MPNIISTQGLTIYNITEVGSAETTGAASTFLINPLEGYYIAASQFSIDEDFDLDAYTQISSITFTDTTSPYTIDNTVLVTINWDGVSSLTSDLNIPIVISFDDTGDVYDSNTTALTFSIAKNDLPELYDNQKVTFTPILDQITNFQAESVESGGYGPDFLINPNHLQFSCFVTQAGQTPILDITIEVNIEGVVFLGDNDGETEPLTLAQTAFPDTSTGTFEFELINTQLDLFENAYLKTYRLYYTRDDSNTDTGAEFVYTSLFPQQYKVKPLVTSILNAGGLGHGDALDGAGTSTSEISKTFGLLNISSDQVYFEYADTWANDGEEIAFFLGTGEDGVESYEYHFDIEANVGSSREMEVTVKDNVYNIQRTTFTIKQDETPFIELKLIGSDDQQFDVYGNILQDPVLLDSGKVISNPSLDDNAFQGIPGGGVAPYYAGADTEVPFVSQPLYGLVVLTDASVGIADLQGALNVQQDGYPLDVFPQADWVSFSDINNFFTLGAGIYITYFSIRNQDKFNYLGAPVTTQDRTATISIAHPFDPTQTDTLTITQDAGYNSAVDTVTIKVDKYITTDGLFGSGEPSYAESSSDNITDNAPTSLSALEGLSAENYRLYIKMDDWENDFNLPNVVTTNPNQTDTYKQYPRPKLIVDYPNGGISILTGQLTSVTGSADGLVIDVDDLVFNENYDPSDSNNDYQYYVDYTLAPNTTYSTRQFTFGVFHSQYNGVYDVNNADDFFIHTQPALQTVSIEPSIEGNENIQYYEGTTDYVLTYNGNTPTLGFITPEIGASSFEEIVFGQQYDDWFTIESLGDANTSFGLTNQSFSVTHAANTPSGDRSIVLALYHSSATPGVDNPDALYTFTQLAQPVNPAIHYVNIFNPISTTLDTSGSSQELTVYFFVGDYTSSDFTNNTNKPDVEIVRWNGPLPESGLYFNENGVYDTEGIIETSYDTDEILQASPSYSSTDPNIGFQHTHSVTFTVQPNNTGLAYYIAVRAKHQYATSYDTDDYVIYSFTGDQSLSFSSAYYDLYGTNNMTTVDGVKQISLPHNAEQLSFVLKYNFLDIEFFDTLWPEGSAGLTYTTARFLSSNNLNVFDEWGGAIYDSIDQNGIPFTFADVGNSNYIFHDGYNETTSDVDNNISAVAATDPNVKFAITLSLNQNTTGDDLTSFIGVWRGEKSPRTNLIDLSSFSTVTGINEENYIDPTYATLSSTHMTQVLGNGGFSGFQVNFYLNGEIINGSILEPVESVSGSGVFDGFNWNYSEASSDTFVDNPAYAVLFIKIFKPILSGGQISLAHEYGFSSDKVLGVSFEVEDFESIGDDVVTCGIISGSGSYWDAVEGVSNVGTVQNSLKFTSNGKYEARIKMTLSTDASHLRFVAKTAARFKIKNFEVWEIEDDISIRPPFSPGDYDQNPEFDTPPDDILKIIQAPAPQALAFDYSISENTELAGSPITLNTPGLFVDTITPGITTFIGQSFGFSLHITPQSFVPVLAIQYSKQQVVDGAISLLPVEYLTFIDGVATPAGEAGGMIPSIEQAFNNNSVGLYLCFMLQNWDDMVYRQIEFRLYDGFNPATMEVSSSAFADGSVDTYKVRQKQLSFEDYTQQAPPGS